VLVEAGWNLCYDQIINWLCNNTLKNESENTYEKKGTVNTPTYINALQKHKDAAATLAYLPGSSVWLSLIFVKPAVSLHPLFLSISPHWSLK